MKIKDFIEKAIEGGWDDDPYVWTGEGANFALCEIGEWKYDYAILLDTEAWKAVGKVEGWVGDKIRMCVGCGVALKWNENPDMEGRHNLKRDGKQVGCGSDIYEYDGQWLIEMHCMIDSLASGKSVEQFLETL